MEHQKFCYHGVEEVYKKIQELNIDLPFSTNTDILFQPITLQGRTLPNRFAIQPMEGCDAQPNGAPGELTTRRYRRFAESGASLIWMEAVSIMPEAKANPRQLMLTEQNVDIFKAFLDDVRETALRETGSVPVLVMQATHSGRYAKPDGKSGARIMYHHPIYEAKVPLDDSCIVSDDELKCIEAQFEVAGRLALAAGFDMVDVKCCHRYLLSEALSAYTRKGPYGGESFENRTRLLRNCVDATKASGVPITCRLNLYDGPAYPYGWGVATDGSTDVDLTEPLKLVELLHKQYGIDLMNLTIGNPYFNPHVNRPYDNGAYIPDEHPLEGLARMCYCIRTAKENNPDVTVISSGNSYLRQFAPNMAAGMVECGGTDMAGFGRMFFAYPDFIEDLRENGTLKKEKSCVTCGKCTELMRMGTVAGCVIRDTDPYSKIYLEKKGK